MIQTITEQYGVHYTDDEVAVLSFDDKSNWLKSETQLLHLGIAITDLLCFPRFLKSTAKPHGEIG